MRSRAELTAQRSPCEINFYFSSRQNKLKKCLVGLRSFERARFFWRPIINREIFCLKNSLIRPFLGTETFPFRFFPDVIIPEDNGEIS